MTQWNDMTEKPEKESLCWIVTVKPQFDGTQYKNKYVLIKAQWSNRSTLYFSEEDPFNFYGEWMRHGRDKITDPVIAWMPYCVPSYETTDKTFKLNMEWL